MEIDSAMLALGADATPNGLIHLFKGGFDVIEVDGLPAHCPPFYLVARILKQGVVEEESHNFRLTGVNPAGESFTLMEEAGMPIMLAPGTYPEAFSKAVIVIEIRMGVKLEGTYHFILDLDGTEVKRLHLRVVIRSPEKSGA
jgi:hypothetical protein